MTTLVTHRLGTFLTEQTYAKLPADVVDYTKLLVLDSIACGLGASRMARTRIAHQVADRLGEAPEATLFGMDRLVPVGPRRLGQRRDHEPARR